MPSATLSSADSSRTRRVLALVAASALTVLGAVSCERQNSPNPSDQPAPTNVPTTRASVISMDPIPPVVPGTENKRYGDEIVVAGRFFRTGTRVVLWTDPGGFDAYRTERRFAPWAESAFIVPGGNRPVPKGQPSEPQRYGLRQRTLASWEELEQVRGGGWTLDLLQQRIDQFVIHYDAIGTSKLCYKVLHDERGLSVQFMLDVDGTIYQTLDAKERAWHATTSNDRSVGIEIANRGAYPSPAPLREFYGHDEKGPFLQFPARFPPDLLAVPPAPGSPLRPIRPELVRGRVNGDMYAMYDLTPQQYAALARLTAALCTALPRITLDFPKDALGRPLKDKLPDDQLARWQGLIGHYNVQAEKNDPGPAFQWERLVMEARQLMSAEALERNHRWRNNPVTPGPLAAVLSTTRPNGAVTTTPSTQPATRPARR